MRGSLRGCAYAARSSGSSSSDCAHATALPDPYSSEIEISLKMTLKILRSHASATTSLPDLLSFMSTTPFMSCRRLPTGGAVPAGGRLYAEVAERTISARQNSAQLD